ncbi:hypothetical protein GOBAR_AA13469 [Gossypium barbadense]|uniref:SGNH hydrolase-type esterase domain-containing protein n=1 Tax=Gossypium barbadense TaxID=3634 RepID=A0A2P5XV11_GOSBA|nr:hypothetical protein GOBAR_AA13469 [Gossypium barbadense]
MLVACSLLHAHRDYRSGMASSIIIPWIFYIQILTISSKAIDAVPAIIVFGDSSIDTGNNNYLPTFAKCNFEPYGRDFPGGTPTGRFCNGRLPPDFVSEGLGLKPIVPAYLDPTFNISDFATGVCFGSSGTGYDNSTAAILKWNSSRITKPNYEPILVMKKANEVISEALYIISVGTNDFLINYYNFPQRRTQFTIPKYEDFLIGNAEDFIRKIYSLGARKLSLTGLPPMGCLPLQRTLNLKNPHSCSEERNKVAFEFNEKLKASVVKLMIELPGLKVLYVDVYELLSRLITRPSRYGKFLMDTHLNMYGIRWDKD